MKLTGVEVARRQRARATLDNHHISVAVETVGATRVSGLLASHRPYASTCRKNADAATERRERRAWLTLAGAPVHRVSAITGATPRPSQPPAQRREAAR